MVFLFIFVCFLYVKNDKVGKIMLCRYFFFIKVGLRYFFGVSLDEIGIGYFGIILNYK